jgi:hypothetical protein
VPLHALSGDMLPQAEQESGRSTVETRLTLLTQGVCMTGLAGQTIWIPSTRMVFD